MKKKTITKAKKYTIWILNFSILGLILTSLFPLISVSENDAVKEDLHFNFEMMKNSGNYEIYSLADTVDTINLLFWAIIILGLISFFCITYLTFLTRWFISLLTIISTAIFIFSVLLIIFQNNFMKAVVNNDFITLSLVYNNITYVHIIFLFIILLLIFSIFYTLNIVLYLGKQIFSSISKKQLLKKNKEKKEDSPLNSIIDEPVTPPPIEINKKIEMEKLPKQEIQKIDVKTEEDSYSELKEEIKPIETTSEEKKLVNNEIATSEKKDEIGPFGHLKREEKPIEPVKPRPSQSFEDALSSAIEKKQGEIGKKEQEKPTSQETIKDSEDKSKEDTPEPIQIDEVEKQIEEPVKEKEFISTEIIVKCPQCTNIFTIKKEETEKIKCPKCGKEGIAQ
jgi:ribosomal protein S27E